MIQFCFASFMQCWDLGWEWSQNCHKILVSVYMGYRPSVQFFSFFLKLILNVIAIIRIKLWTLIFILAIPKSPILFTILSLKQLILKLYHW